MKKLILLLCLFPTLLFAHPDGSKPFWYPSAYIYGFVDGCADTIEKNQPPFTKEMWPEQVRSVCGCVIDALRHSVHFFEVSATDNESQAGVQGIVNATMPLCVNQELTGHPGIPPQN
tara:strand:- start:182 stop:532 length:351 start_codon:yes stop_codon:yes gene_type:complete